MAWVTRGGSRSFYESEREGGRVRRRYWGSGPEAEEAAARSKAFDEHPELAGLLGDLARLAEEALLRLAGQDLAARDGNAAASRLPGLTAPPPGPPRERP